MSDKLGYADELNNTPQTDALVKKLDGEHDCGIAFVWRQMVNLARHMEIEKNSAYHERNQLVAALANIYPSGILKTDITGWDDAWHNCVFIDSPIGQLSWHYHDSEIYLFEHLPSYHGVWDGHSTEDKYARLLIMHCKDEE